MKIVFTWWTYVWKTTILNLLENNWFNVFEEKAGENMFFLMNLLWEFKYRNWREKNFLEFQKMNIVSTLKRDLLLDTKWINILDRWVFDFIASLKRENIDIPDYLEELVSNIDYDYIFFFEEIDKHDMRSFTWRMLGKEKSRLWAKFIYEEYKNRFWENKIIKIPFFDKQNIEENIETRYQFVLEQIKKLS